MGEKAICLIVLVMAMMVIVDSAKMIFGEDEPRERKKPFELIVDDRLISDMVSARTLRRYRRNFHNGSPRVRSPPLRRTGPDGLTLVSGHEPWVAMGSGIII